MKTLKLKQVWSVLLISGTLIGCAPLSPQTKQSALIGAGAGAVASGVTGGNIIEGAAVGAAVGAGVQYIKEHK